MGRPQTYKLGFPLLSILSHKEYIIVSGGVDSEKTTQNKIALYHKNTILTTPLQEINTGKDVIKNLTSNGQTDLLSCTSGRFCILFFIDTVNNLLKEVARFPSDTDCQNASVINSAGDLLITGGDDTMIKIWKITLKEGAVIFRKEREIKSHTSKILHLDISVDDTMVCSASDDGTCRIFDIKTGDMVKKLSFSEDTQDINLKFSFCYFARDEKYMYTIQNPKNSSGSSYLTRWKVADNFDPEKTITLHRKAVSASCINEEGLFMGIGTVDGYSKIISTRHFEIDCGIKAQETEIQSVNFVNDSRALASVCPDYSFYFLPNVRPEGWFSKLSKMWVAAMFIIYFLMLLYDKLGGLFRSSSQQK